MEGREISTTQTSYVLQSWSKQKGLQPIPVQKAEGIYFYDYDGKRYADMSSQQVNVNLGYGNKDISEAIKNKLDQYAYIGPSYGDASRAQLGKMIIDLLPDTFGKVFFTNAGADANENAIKIARMYTGRNKIFSRYRSYHGSSFGAGNLTGEPRRYPLEPGIPGFIKFFDPYLYRETIPFTSEEEASRYYVEKLREQIIYEGPDRVAAIVLETITGSNGVIIPPKGYLPGVRKVCDEFGIVMICDEVMAGWARTGKMFAFENFDVIPDMITFAKGVTCGYIQLGGVAVSKKIAEYFDDHLLSCGLTYSAIPGLRRRRGLCGILRQGTYPGACAGGWKGAGRAAGRTEGKASLRGRRAVYRPVLRGGTCEGQRDEGTAGSLRKGSGRGHGKDYRPAEGTVVLPPIPMKT